MKRKIHAAGVLIENPNGELLTVLRDKGEVEGNTWGPIGGEIKNNENKEEACIREIWEETKLKVNKEDIEFLKTYDNEWKSDGFDIKFEVFRYKLNENNPVISLDADEASEYIWEKPFKLYKRKDLIKGFYVILKDIYKL